jgi:tRNA(Ile)-lysidine synthase
MLTKIVQAIKRHKFLNKGDKVLIACSGGPDSVVLLHLLYGLRFKYNLDLRLAHINHNLRDRDSNKDEAFIKGLAQELALPVYVKSVNVRAFAKREKLTIEETARKVRYEFLDELAKKHGIDRIATAHTLNDQAETVLMRLLRGAGPSGLAGIPVKRGRIIRPLLSITREEILRYLKQNKITYRIDRTNLKSDFLRNRIRNRLIPQLAKEYNPKLIEILSKTAEILSEQEEYLKEKTDKLAEKFITIEGRQAVSLGVARFSKLPEILQRNLVRLAWEKLCKEVYPLDFDEVERVLNLAHQGKTGQRANLQKNFWVEKAHGKIIFFELSKKRVSRKLSGPGKLSIPELRMEVKYDIVRRKKLPKEILSPAENVAYLDYDKFDEPPLLRSWDKGERFKPLGMKGSKKLSDFFTDLKVPRHQRENIPVLSSSGQIAWVIGYRINDDFKVRPDTRKVLRVETRILN